ncbi:hypothetical protein LUZ60_009077 [Juncus effusus]|nr:hypothetical protein LUZ60_009077 [Juncus effusus]
MLQWPIIMMQICFCDDYLLQYVCDSSHILKSWRLIACSEIYTLDVVEGIRNQPLLEELEITLGNFSEDYIASVGEALPNLKQFRLNRIWSNWLNSYEDEEFNNVMAFGIAKTMHQLRHLQLIGNKFTNKGLTAILEGCPHLESLDIRRCNNVKMDSDMRTRCVRLTTFRPPNDTLDDYPHQAESRDDL